MKSLTTVFPSLSKSEVKIKIKTNDPIFQTYSKTSLHTSPLDQQEKSLLLYEEMLENWKKTAKNIAWKQNWNIGESPIMSKADHLVDEKSVKRDRSLNIL
mgnify:FL=1